MHDILDCSLKTYDILLGCKSGNLYICASSYSENQELGFKSTFLLVEREHLRDFFNFFWAASKIKCIFQSNFQPRKCTINFTGFCLSGFNLTIICWIFHQKSRRLIPNASCFVQSVFSLMTSSRHVVVQCEAATLLVELSTAPQVLEVWRQYTCRCVGGNNLHINRVGTHLRD